MNRLPHFSYQDKAALLDELRRLPNLSHAASKVGTTAQTVRRHMADDAAFKAEVDEALEDGADAIEGEAMRRAIDGTSRPVIYQGQITDTYKEVSDSLLVTVLKAHKREMYRDRSEVVHAGSMEIATRLVAARKRVGR
jgi:hypothetical protein